MFWRAYPHGSASIAALADGEIGANRQVCPTIGGGSDTTSKVGRCCRAAQTFTRTSGAMSWRAYPHGSASIAALAGGEIGANRQVCPTIGGGTIGVSSAGGVV
jgi:ABC-type taurine transport system substrate-binding protein